MAHSPMEIGGYTLLYYPKAKECYDEAKGDEKLTLAYYDRRMGAIQKNGETVPNGTFWDFDKKAPKQAEDKHVEVQEEKVAHEQEVTRRRQANAKSHSRKRKVS